MGRIRAPDAHSRRPGFGRASGAGSTLLGVRCTPTQICGRNGSLGPVRLPLLCTLCRHSMATLHSCMTSLLSGPETIRTATYQRHRIKSSECLRSLSTFPVKLRVTGCIFSLSAMVATARNCPLAQEARTRARLISGRVQVAHRTEGVCVSRHPRTSGPTRTGRCNLVPPPSCVPGGARGAQDTCKRAPVPLPCGGECKTSEPPRS